MLLKNKRENMTNNYNLFSFKLSINIYNKLSDNLLKDFQEAVSNELTFRDTVKKLENHYGIKLDISEFNEIFRNEKPELVESQNDKLNNGIVFSVIAALVCELALKYLTVKNGKKFSFTHNLRDLYNKLEISQKDLIKKSTMKKCRFISEEDFENELNDSSENFKTLRYFFEGNNHQLNDIFLKGFKDTLVELVENNK
jgi:HEPN domain-containing protein